MKLAGIALSIVLFASPAAAQVCADFVGATTATVKGAELWSQIRACRAEFAQSRACNLFDLEQISSARTPDVPTGAYWIAYLAEPGKCMRITAQGQLLLGSGSSCNSQHPVLCCR